MIYGATGMSYEQSTHLSYLALGGKETNEILESLRNTERKKTD